MDLRNAYGSIPHELVKAALVRHHMPLKVTALISDNYNNFKMRAVADKSMSDWHVLKRGIITGCTISATLFALSMNMLIKVAETECRGPITRSGLRQPPIRAYTDDMTLTTTSVIGPRWLLKGIEKLITWARMSFNASKSRSFVLKKGILTEEHFKLSGVLIPTIRQNPVKCRGKKFDASLKGSVAIDQTKVNLENWINKVDKSGLPRRFKAWIYQHAILPKLLWPITMYNFTTSTVEIMERGITARLRRWLGLPRSLSSIALHGNSNSLHLPFTSLVEEYKVAKERSTIQYNFSDDSKVALAGIEVYTGRKWKARNKLNMAEERLRAKTILGTVAKGRASLGYFPSIRYDKVAGKEKYALLQEEVQKSEEESRVTKMVGMSKQGAWTKWESIIHQKVKWADIWHYNMGLKFLINAVYRHLPSPANLKLWNKSDSPNYQLCGQIGMLKHILSSCPSALADGRYKWWHDEILKEITEIL